MRFAYADPPYPGRSRNYRGHPDYAGEVDHVALVDELVSFDGYVLHTSSPALFDLLPLFPVGARPRIMPWVKPWAVLKKGQGVVYAWEPVLVRPLRKRPGPESNTPIVRDWVRCMPTFATGVVGAKPPEVIRWLFDVVGLCADDELVDLFPGTGAVGLAWAAWRSQLTIAEAAS